mmetsp:Transcript_41446/g.75090  ORF Transcript_41446/g.75090 Transcript_41446/m.75090 type:complete len:253 (-) Transcript_41446:310-1068(-)
MRPLANPTRPGAQLLSALPDSWLDTWPRSSGQQLCAYWEKPLAVLPALDKQVIAPRLSAYSHLGRPWTPTVWAWKTQPHVQSLGSLQCATGSQALTLNSSRLLSSWAAAAVERVAKTLTSNQTSLRHWERSCQLHQRKTCPSTSLPHPGRHKPPLWSLGCPQEHHHDLPNWCPIPAGTSPLSGRCYCLHSCGATGRGHTPRQAHRWEDQATHWPTLLMPASLWKSFSASHHCQLWLQTLALPQASRFQRLGV